MFNKDFVWGVATASYQIEGAAYEDGKGLSIWDDFCKQDGRIFMGHSGDVACDHYHRFRDDFKLMKDLGIKNYRFSVSWPRIIPKGTGEVNPKGIEFYNNLIDSMIENGITPYMTLYHWDLPLELHYKGGWLNRESSDWFYEYAKVIAENFGDRVKYFFTFNEPQCFIGQSYSRMLTQAPGIRYSNGEVVKMAHNVMMAHGKACMALREFSKADVKVGYAPTYCYWYPQDESNQAEVDASYEKSFKTERDPNGFGWLSAWWSDPVILGSYPEDGLELYGKYLPDTWKEDLKIMCQPLDFLGQNIYNGTEGHLDENGNFVDTKKYDGFPRTANMWHVTPNALKYAAIHLYRRYKLPIYITENGLCNQDVVSLDGKVHDPQRIDFLNRYLIALDEAIESGAKVDGYFQWSFMDNFEWANGYRDRFGLVYINYQTQERIPKDSAYWYKEVIETNGEKLYEHLK